jgi:CheY-like chemotaxis protein
MARLPMAMPQLEWSREVIERQVVHLTRLVDDLLDVSRITRGIINLSREPLSLQTVIARTIETLQPSITQQGHELVTQVTDEPLEVEGDLTRLTQMVGNLLSNAAKYTNPGGRIELLLDRVGDQARIRVRDNGIGIAPESLPRLFTLFSQLPTDDPRMQGGLGIGLALVQRLAVMHNGRVEGHSDGAGQGSTFTVTLPLRAAGRVEPAAAAPQAVEEANVPPRRILVADDNIDALESLAMLLEFAGHDVRTARDGVEALECARGWQPEVMLLDLGMPRLTGYELARKIRSEPWGAAVQLVAISGWGQSDDLRRSRECGFDQHLVKPISFEALHGLLTPG